MHLGLKCLLRQRLKLDIGVEPFGGELLQLRPSRHQLIESIRDCLRLTSQLFNRCVETLQSSLQLRLCAFLPGQNRSQIVANLGICLFDRGLRNVGEIMPGQFDNGLAATFHVLIHLTIDGFVFPPHVRGFFPRLIESAAKVGKYLSSGNSHRHHSVICP